MVVVDVEVDKDGDFAFEKLGHPLSLQGWVEKKAGMMLSRSRVVGRFIIIENHRNQCRTNSRNESRSRVKDRYRGCFSRNRKVAPALQLCWGLLFLVVQW